MLGQFRAQEMDVVSSLPALIKHPSFAEKRPLWIKETKHPSIDAKVIKSKRYQYIKIGKTFGFQTTRYMTLYRDCLFYYDNEDDKEFKGYCGIENIYVQWLKLKGGRFLLFSTNGSESSFFYFETTSFWDDLRPYLGKYAIQLDFQERYVMLEAIGKGSFSKVQKVRCTFSGRQFAAKIISKKDKNNSPTKNLVIEERKILRLIKSQYIYTFEELFQDEDFFIFIMEYLPGKDLMTLWKEKKLTEPGLVVPLLRQILEGVRDIHNAGVIHRDLKPQNILINLNTYRPHIIDFGLSLFLDQTVSPKSYKRCGTMGYMAPQVIENSGQSKKPYGNKCDLFSFGIIAHMLLLGFNPVKGDNYDETFVKNKACEIIIDKEVANGKYGQYCFMFLTKLLSKYPQYRFDSDQALKCQFFTQKHYLHHFHDKQQSSSTMQDKKFQYHSGVNKK